MIPTFIPVVSSNISKIGYDANTETLYVEFKSGGLYKYAGVPVQTYLDFIRADSFGKFLASIKHDFAYEKIDLDSLVPRIFMTLDDDGMHVNATIDCLVVVIDRSITPTTIKVSFDCKAVTNDELDRLIRLEENDFPSEEA
jgi:hypothetical protein